MPLLLAAAALLLLPPLSAAYDVAAPANATTAEVVYSLESTTRSIALLDTINPFTAVLPTPHPDLQTNVTVGPNGTWALPICAAPLELDCLWAGEAAVVTYRDATGATVATESIHIPEFCAIALEDWVRVNSTWCATVVVDVADDAGDIDGANATITAIGVYGDRVEAPLFPDITQWYLQDLRSDIPYDPDGTEVCGLVPIGRYHLWAGNGVARCTTNVFAPTIANTMTPTLVRIPSSIGATSVSFYLRLVNETDAVTHILVEWEDTLTNTTYQTVWSGTALVRTVQVGVPGVVYRTFITITGGPVFPNTRYRLRAAIADASGAAITAFTEYLVETTRTAVQSRPLQPIVTETADGRVHVAFDTAGFRPYGNNNTVVFTVLVDVPDSLENLVTETIRCPGLCPGGITLEQSTATRFVQLVVANERGVSEASGASVIQRLAPTDDDGGLGAAAVAAIAVGALVFVALVAIIAWQSTRKPVIVEVLRPEPDPNVEIAREAIIRKGELGEGSTSIVYEAVYDGRRANTDDTRDRTPVAVKQMRTALSAAQIEGFFGEIAALSQLKHPNIIALFGAVTVGNPVLVVTELCVNGALDSYLKSHDVPHGRLFDWAAQMAVAVQYLHGESIVHRDLACRNFLIDAAWVIKLCDLGMCKTLDYSSQYRQRSETLSLAVRWAAPISLINGTFHRGTDVWSLCASYYELYTHGQLPYSNIKSYRAVYESILSAVRLTIPSAMPSAMAAVCAEVWATDHLDGVTIAMFAPVFSELRAGSPVVRVAAAGAAAAAGPAPSPTPSSSPFRTTTI